MSTAGSGQVNTSIEEDNDSLKEKGNFGKTETGELVQLENFSESDFKYTVKKNNENE